MKLQVDGAQLTEADLENPRKIGKLAPEIKKLFVQQSIDVNEASMIVYSGPSHSDFPIYSRLGLNYLYNFIHYFRHWPHDEFIFAPACLFTGDCVLNLDRLNSTTSVLGQLTSNIGTLQIPHHGSVNNFFIDDYLQSGLSNNRPMFTFASYGDRNRYGHPSTKVISDLLLYALYFHGVTESQNSQFYQIIK